MDNVLVIIKPDAFERGIAHQVYTEFVSSIDAVEVITAQQIRPISRMEAEELYQEHKNKEFFNDLVEFMCSGRTTILLVKVWGKEDGVKTVREVVKAIREKHATSIRHNCIHASDSLESGKRETAIFFKEYQ